AGQTYYVGAKFYSSVPIGDITVSISESFSNFTKAPDSTTIIDIENKLIYNLAPGLASYDILNRYISVSGDYYVEFSCASLGTGSILSLYNYQTSDLVDEYTILIFGDVNGDGWYDGTDAMIVNCLLNGLLTREQVGEAVWAAADCNHDGVIDAFDVALLEKAGLLLSQIDQSKSESELLESDAYIEYQSLIDQSPVLTDSEPEVTPDPEPETEPTIFEQIVSFIKQAVEFILSFVKMLYK
ncbi:MAG: dockerin type I repeat-containing protein, partial [Acutalibacteraceae bacterium]